MNDSNQTKSGRAKPARTSKRTHSSKGTAKQSSPQNFPEPDPVKETPIPAELPDYEIGPSESHSPAHFLGNLVRDTRARILLAVLFLGLLAWMAAPPVYQRIKIYRAMQFLQQSEVALSEENAPKALSLMRRAILMAPNEENVFRKVRLFNASLGDPAALSSIQQLMLEKQASSEELLALAKQALKTNNVLIAKSALEGLQDDRSTEKFILEMRLLELEGNQAAALDLARKELPTLPPEGAEKLLLATAEMTLKSDPAASQQILVQLVDNDSATGMTALRMLAAQQLFQPTQKSKQTDNLAEKILSHPLRTRGGSCGSVF
jgi:tetratricopeptide (TPR) repeat protein